MTLTKRLAMAAWTAFLALPTGAAASSALDEFDRATRLAMVEDYQGALKEYEAFLYQHPDHELAPVAAMAAGNLYLEALEDRGAAIRHFDLVLTDYRSSSWAPEAAFRKGAALMAEEAWADAAAAFETALDLNAGPGSAQSGRWIIETASSAADCYSRLGNHEKVLDTYQRALDASPPPEVTATALFRMGEAYESMEKPARAAQCYAGILERAPCASGQIFAQVLAKQGLIEEHATLDLAPYLAYDRTYQFIRQRDFAGSLEQCKEAEALSRSPALLECIEARRISLEATISADFPEGIRRMNQHREKYPGGQLDERIGAIVDFWTSIVDAEAEVTRDPDNAAGLSGLGVLYYYTGSYGPAIETLLRAQKLDPGQTATYELLGLAYYATGQMEEAVRQFDYFLESETPPEEGGVFTTAGTACMRLEQFDKAVRYYERQAELSPDDPSAHSNLADGLYRARRPAEAAAACRKALDLDANSSSSCFILGRVHQENGDKAEAVQYFERFLELVPEGEHADEARKAIEELRG